METGSAPLRRKQVGVAIGMALGFAATLAAFLWPGLPRGPTDVSARLLLWLACDLAAGAWLLIAVGLLARHRFFSAADIDGAGLTEGSPQARLLQALVQNTLEQTVLAIAAWGAWLALTTSAGLMVVCVALFSVGRLLFFVGYRRGAAFRALGFALTFYPTVGLFLLLLAPALARMAGVFDRA